MIIQNKLLILWTMKSFQARKVRERNIISCTTIKGVIYVWFGLTNFCEGFRLYEYFNTAFGVLKIVGNERNKYERIKIANLATKNMWQEIDKNVLIKLTILEA